MPINWLGYTAADQAAAAQNDPIRQAVQGYGTMQALQGQSARNQLSNLELEKAKTQQEALKGYGATGDIGAVMQKDPMLGLKLTEAQFGIANAATKYWDNTKTGLTKETYGPWQEDMFKKFPMLNKSQFPDPSTFKTDEDFNKWKYEKEIMAARFKAMTQGPKVVAPGAALVGQNNEEIYRNPVKPLQEREYPVYDSEGNLKETVTGTGKPFQLRRPKEDQRPTNFESLYQQELKTRPELTRKQLRIEMIEKETAAKTKPLTPKQIAEGKIAEKRAARQSKLGGETAPTVFAPTQQDYYGSFSKAIQGPNRDEAIRRAKKDYPDYLDRAKKEGLLQ